MSTAASTPAPSHGSSFTATRWTLVLRSQGESPAAKAALGELCEAYYAPVFRFLRSEGRPEDTARELTQAFFSHILSHGAFDHAQPERGRFRSYLLGALKHFLADHRKWAHRLKRGGGAEPQSMDAEDETSQEALQISDSATGSPDQHFDREWALQVMERGLKSVASDFETPQRSHQFEILKPWLMGETEGGSQAEAASTLGVSEGAVKVMIHRMRKRFREAIRDEIGQTLRDPSMVDQELQHLIEALS